MEVNRGEISILIVDDEASIGELCKDIFSSEGFPSEFVTSGEEALDFLQDNSVKIILSDSNMPRMTGVQLFEAIKDKFGSTPIFYLSSGDSDIIQEEQKMILKGIRGIIKKPYILEELLGSITSGLLKKAS